MLVMLICSHLCSMSLKRRKKSKSFLFRCTGIQQLNPHISNYTFVIKICLLRILLLWLKLSGYSKRVFSLNSHQQEKKSLQRQIWALKVVRKSSIPFLKCLLINKASAVNSAILSLNCLEWSFVKVIYKENSCRVQLMVYIPLSAFADTAPDVIVSVVTGYQQ